MTGFKSAGIAVLLALSGAASPAFAFTQEAIPQNVGGVNFSNPNAPTDQTTNSDQSGFSVHTYGFSGNGQGGGYNDDRPQTRAQSMGFGNSPFLNNYDNGN